MSLLRSAIGTVLRRLRQAQGRTLQDVADAAGVSLAYLSEVERGLKEASSEILAVICRALGIDLPDLLDEVRAELLRTAPGVVPARRPEIRMRAATCGSAGGRSASGRPTSHPRAYAARLGHCPSGARGSAVLSRRPR